MFERDPDAKPAQDPKPVLPVAGESLQAGSSATQPGTPATNHTDKVQARRERAAQRDRLARFQRGRRLATGSQGTVEEASHPEWGEVILKTIHHPRQGYKPPPPHRHIATVYDHFECDDKMFLAVERCIGCTLTDWFKRQTEFSPKLLAKLIAQIAQGLHAAHEVGLVHRDLKPDNVMLVGPSSEPVPKIIDFDLAKNLSADGGTATTAILGTPEYMSPEQARGDAANVDRRADVYALGVILYESLTGRRPFKGATPQLTLDDVKNPDLDPLPPRRFNPQAPRSLELIALQCLRKNPNDRYATAADVADDLQRFLDGKPVMARPESVVRRTGKWVRNHTRLVAGITMSLLLASAATAFTVQRIDHAKEQAAERARRVEDLRGYVAALLADAEQTRLYIGDSPGLQQLLQSKLSTAAEALEKLTSDPTVMRLHRSRLAELYHQLGVASDLVGSRDSSGKSRDRAAVDRLQRAVDLRRELVAEAPNDSRRVIQLAQSLTALASARRYLETGPTTEENYREAIALLRGLPPASGSNGIDVDIARALSGLAETIKLEKGRADEAMQLLDEGIALIADNPDDEAVALHSEMSVLRGGLLTNAGRWDDARTAYDEALRTIETLREKYPTRSEYTRDSGSAYSDLGLALYIRGDLKRGLPNLEKAVEIRKQLVERNPSVTRFQHNLAMSYNILGLVSMSRIGGQDRARELFEKALPLRASLAARFPERNDYRNSLLLVQQNLVYLDLTTSRNTEAARMLDDLIAARESLHASNPKIAGYSWFLGYALNMRGGIPGKQNEGDLERARRLFREIVDANPGEKMYRDGQVQNGLAYARLFAARGQIPSALAKLDEAATIAEAIETSTPEYARHYAELLTLRGELRAKAGNRDGALADLRKAVEVAERIAKADPTQWEHARALAEARAALAKVDPQPTGNQP